MGSGSVRARGRGVGIHGIGFTSGGLPGLKITFVLGRAFANLRRSQSVKEGIVARIS